MCTFNLPENVDNIHYQGSMENNLLVTGNKGEVAYIKPPNVTIDVSQFIALGS